MALENLQAIDTNDVQKDIVDIDGKELQDFLKTEENTKALGEYLKENTTELQNIKVDIGSIQNLFADEKNVLTPTQKYDIADFMVKWNSANGIEDNSENATEYMKHQENIAKIKKTVPTTLWDGMTISDEISTNTDGSYSVHLLNKRDGVLTNDFADEKNTIDFTLNNGVVTLKSTEGIVPKIKLQSSATVEGTTTYSQTEYTPTIINGKLTLTAGKPIEIESANAIDETTVKDIPDGFGYDVVVDKTGVKIGNTTTGSFDTKYQYDFHSDGSKVEEEILIGDKTFLLKASKDKVVIKDVTSKVERKENKANEKQKETTTEIAQNTEKPIGVTDAMVKSLLQFDAEGTCALDAKKTPLRVENSGNVIYYNATLKTESITNENGTITTVDKVAFAENTEGFTAYANNATWPEGFTKETYSLTPEGKITTTDKTEVTTYTDPTTGKVLTMKYDIVKNEITLAETSDSKKVALENAYTAQRNEILKAFPDGIATKAFEKNALTDQIENTVTIDGKVHDLTDMVTGSVQEKQLGDKRLRRTGETYHYGTETEKNLTTGLTGKSIPTIMNEYTLTEKSTVDNVEQTNISLLTEKKYFTALEAYFKANPTEALARQGVSALQEEKVAIEQTKKDAMSVIQESFTTGYTDLIKNPVASGLITEKAKTLATEKFANGIGADKMKGFSDAMRTYVSDQLPKEQKIVDGNINIPTELSGLVGASIDGKIKVAAENIATAETAYTTDIAATDAKLLTAYKNTLDDVDAPGLFMKFLKDNKDTYYSSMAVGQDGKQVGDAALKLDDKKFTFENGTWLDAGKTSIEELNNLATVNENITKQLTERKTLGKRSDTYTMQLEKSENGYVLKLDVAGQTSPVIVENFLYLDGKFTTANDNVAHFDLSKTGELGFVGADGLIYGIGATESANAATEIGKLFAEYTKPENEKSIAYADKSAWEKGTLDDKMASIVAQYKIDKITGTKIDNAAAVVAKTASNTDKNTAFTNVDGMTAEQKSYNESSNSRRTEIGTKITENVGNIATENLPIYNTLVEAYNTGNATGLQTIVKDYYKGTIDGKTGPKTLDAVNTYLATLEAARTATTTEKQLTPVEKVNEGITNEKKVAISEKNINTISDDTKVIFTQDTFSLTHRILDSDYFSKLSNHNKVVMIEGAQKEIAKGLANTTFDYKGKKVSFTANDADGTFGEKSVAALKALANKVKGKESTVETEILAKTNTLYKEGVDIIHSNLYGGLQKIKAALDSYTKLEKSEDTTISNRAKERIDAIEKTLKSKYSEMIYGVVSELDIDFGGTGSNNDESSDNFSYDLASKIVNGEKIFCTIREFKTLENYITTNKDMIGEYADYTYLPLFSNPTMVRDKEKNKEIVNKCFNSIAINKTFQNPFTI